MRHSKLMKERVRRVAVLLRELGYEQLEGELADDSYTAAFEGPDGFQAGLFIDRESKFLELVYSFAFSSNLTQFLQDRLEEMYQICYEYGCHTNLQTTDLGVSFSVFSKIYFAGLNYYALKETVRDFRAAVESLVLILQLPNEVERESHDETG
jgi:hypothetical protein